MASTETMTLQDTLDSQYLSSSISNLSRSKSANSFIVRTYKQATQLYLTKRFKEALETLSPIISPQQLSRDDTNSVETNGVQHANGDNTASQLVPVAQTSKGTRTKVWVFYLSLLHAIIDLGPEQGKLQFGSAQWRQLGALAKDGTVWEDIVQRGYGGNEGDVDAEVVANLATLLLGHMSSQKLNQQRLETWLSASASTDTGSHVQFADGTMSPMPNGMSTPSSSPKSLATRLKILELYALHVLPANEEWTYAKEFIELNDSLDQERKEAFLHALQQLKDDNEGVAQRERELAEQREREMEEQRHADEARALEEAKSEEERRKAAEAERHRAFNGSTAGAKAANGHSRPHVNGLVRPSATAAPRPAAKAQKKPPPSPPPSSPNFYRRASSVLNNIQQAILQASRQMTVGNSMALFRLLMFMLAFLIIVARRDLRLKIKRILEDGWMKVKKTVGMGTKVSYI